jgi:amino acid transporter
MTEPLAPTTLERAVSRWQIVALALNDVVGSGVYLLPAAAVALLGPASVWAVALAGVAVFVIVLCFAEAATYFEEPGSAYLYARTAFGDLVGFQVGWMTWLTRVTSIASLSAGFAQAVAYLWPGADQGAGRAVTVTVPLLGLAALNYVGVRSGARTAVVLAIGKLVPLFVFVAAGLFAARWALIGEQTATSTSPGRLGEAVLLLLYAYAGFENTAAAAGEYKNPRRDVPFALLVHIGVVTALYVAVQAVALATLPDAGASATPLADAARLFLGPLGGLLLTVGAVISILGTNGNTVFAGPRYLFALGRDGYGPRALAAVHPRFRTPAVALVATVAIAWPLALTGTFVGLAALSVVTRLATYIGTAAAVPVLRRKLAARPGAFRLPGGPAIPVLAVALALVFAASATRENLVAAAVAVAVGMGVFLLRGRPQPRRHRP